MAKETVIPASTSFFMVLECFCIKAFIFNQLQINKLTHQSSFKRAKVRLFTNNTITLC